jgi:hypothetical protein
VRCARRPAAYISVVPAPETATEARCRQAMMQESRQRGWPAPIIYADSDRGFGADADSALARLEAAISAGRHDALLVTVPGVLHDPAPLMRLLAGCTKHGVTVSFVPAIADSPVHDTADRPIDLAGARPRSAPAPAPAPAGPGCQASSEPWSVLVRARLEALAGLFPGWRIWLDQRGWHARRRDGFLQGYRPGAPAFCVSAQTAVDLAAQICWQQAADVHVPDGCAAGQRAHTGTGS